MNQYENLLATITARGHHKSDRTGTGTTSLFGCQMHFNFKDGFPLITTKKVHIKSIINELLWFIRGDTNVSWLQEQGCTIWDEWALPENEVESVPRDGYDRAVLAAAHQNVTVQEMQRMLAQKDNEESEGGSKWLDSLGIYGTKNVITRKKGDLGPVYGQQWRSWPANEQGVKIDQLAEAIKLLKTDPDSRRIIVSAWNVADLPKMALMPCHAMFQFYTRLLTFDERMELLIAQGNDMVASASEEFKHQCLTEVGIPERALSCQLYQRSADMFLGVPFNIASYSFLTYMVAQQCNMMPEAFVWTGGDCHIYDNHKEQVALQLSRQPMPYPTLKLNGKLSIDDYAFDDFQIVGYAPHPAIKAPVAV